MDFQLVSDYKPTGDQPEAIEKLTWGVKNGLPEQVVFFHFSKQLFVLWTLKIFAGLLIHKDILI